jgi:hypothetical protein
MCKGFVCVYVSVFHNIVRVQRVLFVQQVVVLAKLIYVNMHLLLRQQDASMCFTLDYIYAV